MPRVLLAMLALCTLLVATGLDQTPSRAAQDAPINTTSLVDGVTISQVGFSRDTRGNLYVYGEVSNQTERAIGNLGVVVELYNGSDERLARGIAPSVGVNILNPGNKTVWEVSLTDHPASWARTDIRVGLLGGTQQMAADADYADLALTNVNSMPSVNIPGGIDVTGTATNTGSGIARGLEFAAAFYDDSGKLLSVCPARQPDPRHGQFAAG